MATPFETGVRPCLKRISAVFWAAKLCHQSSIPRMSEPRSDVDPLTTFFYIKQRLTNEVGPIAVNESFRWSVDHMSGLPYALFRRGLVYECVVLTLRHTTQ